MFDIILFKKYRNCLMGSTTFTLNRFGTNAWSLLRKEFSLYSLNRVHVVVLTGVINKFSRTYNSFLTQEKKFTRSTWLN